MNLDNIDPVDLGLPERFAEFRPCQREAVEFILDSPKRFVGAALPTGSGKSLIAVAAHRAERARTVILTSTRGLQDQYASVFADCGMVDIRGKSNYKCDQRPWLTCRFGGLEGCKLTDGGGCNYECHRAQARNADLVVTNYAYWLRVNEFFPGLSRVDPEEPDSITNPVDLLICDEAHNAAEELSNYLKVELRESWLHTGKLRRLGIDLDNEDIVQWSQFAWRHLDKVAERFRDALRELKLNSTKHNRELVWELESLLEALTKISRMSGSDAWVCEVRPGTRYGRVWEFNCAWPASWSHLLFQSVPKVVLMSATLRPNAFSMLGVSKSDFDFHEWPRVFPANHTPIYHIPTVKMNHRITEEGLSIWVKRIDEIIDSRQDRKGIIHTVSFNRQRYLLDQSRFSRFMVANDNDPESPTSAEVVDSFKALQPPAILVSPSFSTGWDFPRRNCEFQIIAKIPYPDTRAKVIQARLARLPSYADALAMTELVQSAGRATRDEADRCEIFIIDDGILWFMVRNKYMKPMWFQIQYMQQIPPPGPRCIA